jgi:hypothetical protein
LISTVRAPLSGFAQPAHAERIADPTGFALVTRVVEGLVAARPARYALYLVRPDAAVALAEESRYRTLISQAARALLLTGWGDPEPLAGATSSARARRYHQAQRCWATLVLGPDLAMAVVAPAAEDGQPTGGFLTTDAQAVRQMAATIEGWAADPQTELRAV